MPAVGEPLGRGVVEGAWPLRMRFLGRRRDVVVLVRGPWRGEEFRSALSVVWLGGSALGHALRVGACGEGLRVRVFGEPVDEVRCELRARRLEAEADRLSWIGLPGTPSVRLERVERVERPGAEVAEVRAAPDWSDARWLGTLLGVAAAAWTLWRGAPSLLAAAAPMESGFELEAAAAGGPMLSGGTLRLPPADWP